MSGRSPRRTRAALDLETALRVAVCRGKAVSSTHGTGAMATVDLGPEETAGLLRSGERAWISSTVTPSRTLVSGDNDALTALASRLVRQGMRLALRHPYPLHCPLMEPARPRLLADLRGLTARVPEVALYSALNGGAAAPDAYGARYWGRTLVAPARFHEVVRAAAGEGPVTMLEIGPRASLSPAVRTVLRHHGVEAAVVPSMRAHQDARPTLERAARTLRDLGHVPGT